MVVGKKLYGLMVVLVLSALWTVLDVRVVSALGATLDVSTTYTINDTSATQIRSIINITNTDGEGSIPSLEIPAPGTNVSNVRAFYQDDEQLEASYDKERNIITLVTSRDFSGDGRQWSVVVDYESQVGIELGNTFVVQVPATEFPNHQVVAESISLNSASSLGVASRKGLEPTRSQLAAGQQLLTWENDSGPIGEPVGLTFGDDGVADVVVRTTLSNASWWWRTETVTLPPDTNHQGSFLRSMNPAPSNLRLDLDGNILAEYRLRPKMNLDITAEAEIQVTNVRYLFEEIGAISSIPPELSANYTATVGPWTKTIDAVEGDTTQVTLQKFYDDAVQFQSGASNSFMQAQETANRLIGNLRAANLPARLVLGKVFVDDSSVSSSAKSHAWVEVFLPSIGWATLDPLLDDQAGNFGSSDVRHVGLLLRGINPDFPPERLNNTSVNYGSAEEIAQSSILPILNARRHMILPGIALRSSSVVVPDGPIVDNTGIKVNDEPARALGSLAPLQNAKVRSFDFAGKAFSSDPIEYGIIEGGELVSVLQTSTIDVNYVPMLIIFALGATGFITIYLTRKHNAKKLEKIHSSKDAFVLASEDSGDSIELSDLVDEPDLMPKKTTPDNGATIPVVKSTTAKPVAQTTKQRQVRVTQGSRQRRSGARRRRNKLVQ